MLSAKQLKQFQFCVDENINMFVNLVIFRKFSNIKLLFNKLAALRVAAGQRGFTAAVQRGLVFESVVEIVLRFSCFLKYLGEKC